MAVSDILKDIGRGAEAVGKAAVPVLERTAQVVSGEAPQIDEENRKRQEKLEDEQLAIKSSTLENNLALGQKYGTLTPEQQQQYIDEITGLYSHPRHAPVLMEKLRKAIHPNGATAQAPQAPLANPVPQGGTVQADEKARESALADALSLRQGATDEEIDRRAKDAAQYHKAAGKSPPVSGNQLPADAIGPDGQPISSADRIAQKSFMEWNGVWYSAPKAKPIYRIVGGNVVLMDPNTGLPMRNLGPSAGVKISTHQTPFLGDDQQMHLLTTTSVSTPEGESIDVEAPPPDDKSGEKPSSSSSGQKTPAKKVNPGSILPKTGAKPPGMGPAIPGSHAWAQSKNPVFKADASSYKKANDDAIVKGELYKNASGLLADNSRQTDLELIFAWVRSNIQGAGRLTNTEIQQAATAGSYGTRIKSAFDQASSGRIAPELEQQFLSDIKRSADTAQKTASDLRNQLGAPDDSSGGAENWVRGPDGKLVKQ